VEGKLFLKQVLGLTSSEISFNSLPAGKSVPFYHKHRVNEEIYVFLSGQGEFQVDDQVCWVHEGTVLRIDPEGVRRLHNSSTEQDLLYVVIQARANSQTDHTIQDGVLVQK
jgi:mannose-6-phosphate isomerase-like protein (cupin superfamily)